MYPSNTGYTCRAQIMMDYTIPSESYTAADGAQTRKCSNVTRTSPRMEFRSWNETTPYTTKSLEMGVEQSAFQVHGSPYTLNAE